MFRRNDKIWWKGIICNASSVPSNQTRRYKTRKLRKNYLVPQDFSWIKNFKLHIHREKRRKDSAGSFQVCTSQEAELEAVIHAINDVCQQDETKADPLAEFDNAFNSVSRKEIIHNISITCALIKIFFWNCYMKIVRLFVVGNHEIKSREGAAQGDPTTMGASAVGITPLIHFLSKFIFTNKHRSKEVAFADNFKVVGKASKIKVYWNIIQQQGSFLATSLIHPNHIWMWKNSVLIKQMMFSLVERWK